MLMVGVPHQRIIKRVLVNHRAAAGIDQDRRRFHQPQLACSDQLVRRCVERDVQSDDVGAPQQLGEQREAHANYLYLSIAKSITCSTDHSDWRAWYFRFRSGSGYLFIRRALAHQFLLFNLTAPAAAGRLVSQHAASVASKT